LEAELAFFLAKTEPSVYSFGDLEREGATVWDGVTNNLALMNIRSMKTGDECMIYHSGDECAVVGIARVTRGAYPDPNQRNEKLVVVRLESVKRLRKPVTLAELKGRDEFKDFDLIRLPRLSVMRVPEKFWKIILEMSERD
jgi:predicted RNA-binding protein with PUA-like domain